MTNQVLLFYKYVTIEDPRGLAAWVKTRAEHFGFTGRVIIAEEGINGTLEGSTENTEAFALEILSADSPVNGIFSDMLIKRSEGTGKAFPKLSVKVRMEIVGTRFSPYDADPRVRTAPRVSAEELKQMYENEEDFVVIDMRNSYEIASGKFKNTIDPGLGNSRDLPNALPALEPLKKKKVITVCTGGIRCEKMSALLLSNGFENVSQLENGIHGYMEKYPGEDFEGSLYTFDQRKVMDFGGDRAVIGTCYKCGISSEQYVNCANLLCHKHFIVCDSCMNDDGSAVCSNECKVIFANNMVGIADSKQTLTTENVQA
jgi:UPF0176 protein